MWRKFISTLIYILLASRVSQAVIIYVEIPDYIELEKLQVGDSITVVKLEAVIDSQVNAFIVELDTSWKGFLDIEVVCVKNGMIPLPDTIKLKEEGWGLGNPPAGELTLERGDGWADSEWEQVKHHFDLAYPRIKDIYGSPFEKVTVKIEKDPNILPAHGLFTVYPFLKI